MDKPYYDAGMYLATVLDHGFGRTKNNFPQLWIKVMPSGTLVTKHDGAGEAVEEFTALDADKKAYERTIYMVIKAEDKSLDYAIRKLRATGWDGTDLNELDLRKAEIRVECRHETYENKTRDKWELPLPERTGAVPESDPSLAFELNALFGRRLTETVDQAKPVRLAMDGPLAPGTPGAAQEAALQRPAGIEDDDIPFSVVLVPLASALAGLLA